MTKIRYCEYCGSTLLPDAQFCENCGRPAAPVLRQNSRKRNDTAAEKVKREAESQTPERRVRRAPERTGESRRTEATYGSEVSGQRVRRAPERTGESRRMETASGSEVSGQRVRRAPERTGESRRTETASGSEVSGRRVRRVPERTRGGRPVRRMAEERMEERDSGVFRERGADPQKSGSVQESRIYVPGEKVRARREADAARNLQNRGRAYVPGEKTRERPGAEPYGRSSGKRSAVWRRTEKRRGQRLQRRIHASGLSVSGVPLPAAAAGSTMGGILEPDGRGGESERKSCSVRADRGCCYPGGGYYRLLRFLVFRKIRRKKGG